MAKAKRRRKAASKKAARRTRRTARRPAPRTNPVSAAVQALQGHRSELLTERGRIEKELAKIDHALKAMGALAPRGKAAAAGRPARGRPAGRPGSLKSYLGKVLSGGETMTVSDITAAVRKSGYKTSNKTLAKSVGIALTQMPNVTRVARGRFRLR